MKQMDENIEDKYSKPYEVIHRKDQDLQCQYGCAQGQLDLMGRPWLEFRMQHWTTTIHQRDSTSYHYHTR
jgi:hypothetical protein